MLERPYSVTFSGVTGTAAQDLFEISPADDKPVKLAGLFISQSSDVGDTAEEMLRIEIIRGYSSSGSGGTSPTPTPLNPNGAAASFTAEVNNTTPASSGSPVTIHAEAFNIRSGMQHFWTPETMPVCTQAQTTIVVRLVQAPADALTLAGTLYLLEL